MSPLNRLEKAVLEEILCQAGGDALPLREQIQGAFVVDRINTGAGFYTRLQTERRGEPIGARIIGDVAAQIKGLSNPMIFLLWVRNGTIDQLEGASVGDSTQGVDFSNVQFEIIEGHGVQTSS
jgi:hypothetical protein